LVREDVEEEAANELVDSERHCLGFVAGAVVLLPETDMAVFAGEETTIGDGDAMGIAAEIVEHLRQFTKPPLHPIRFDVRKLLTSSAERALGVDHPSDRKAQERRMNMQF
jgi:hypothetical protein